MKLNLNDRVTGILTPAGASVYNSWNSQFPSVYQKAPRQVGDHLKLPLWELMQVFGQHTFHGMPQVHFEGNSVYVEGAQENRSAETFEQLADRAYETAMGQELRPRDKAGVLKVLAAFRDELAKGREPVAFTNRAQLEHVTSDGLLHPDIPLAMWSGKTSYADANIPLYTHPFVAAPAECQHTKTISQFTGDGSEVEFCQDCGTNCLVSNAAPADAVANDAEVESLRAQLAEEQAETAELREQLNAAAMQLLATQARAARLVEAVKRAHEKADSAPQGGAQYRSELLRDARDILRSALSTPINLNALHEDQAQVLDDAAKVAALSSEGAANAIRVMAAAHRDRISAPISVSQTNAKEGR